MTLLFTADSGEWQGTDCSWRPMKEPAEASPNPTDASIGRGYALYVFRCPASFEHPARHRDAVIIPDSRLVTDALL